METKNNLKQLEYKTLDKLLEAVLLGAVDEPVYISKEIDLTSNPTRKLKSMLQTITNDLLLLGFTDTKNVNKISIEDVENDMIKITFVSDSSFKVFVESDEVTEEYDSNNSILPKVPKFPDF